MLYSFLFARVAWVLDEGFHKPHSGCLISGVSQNEDENECPCVWSIYLLYMLYMDPLGFWYRQGLVLIPTFYVFRQIFKHVLVM